MYRIVIECGSTYSTNYLSGIQRVVFSITKALKDLNNPKIVFVVVKNGKLFDISKELTDENIQRKLNGVQNYIIYIIKYISKIELIKKTIQKYYFLNKIYAFIRNKLRNIKSNKIIKLKEGDVLLALDATWTEEFKNYIKKINVKITFIPIVYDLIPYKYPEFFERNTIKNYEMWWKYAFKRADGILCISESVIDELNNEIVNKRIDCDVGPKNIKKISMGSLSRREINFKQDNFVNFLMVGTIEPRKNHTLALETFNKLWIEGLNIKLLIIGRKGWKNNDTIELINKSKYLNKNLFWLDNCLDSELIRYYYESDFLLQCSYAEGFGLPLLEASDCALKVICSDIPVFNEILGSNGIYFESNNISSLEKVIRNEYAKKVVEKKATKGNKIYCESWTNSAVKLIYNIEDMRRNSSG